MSASALIDELTAAGVRLSLDGGDLVADVLPGVELEPYRDRIAQCRPALLTLLREREVITDLTDQLETGWRWLDEHPHHPEHEAFLDRWTARLREYERIYATHHEHEHGEASCRVS
jgi:hypothetical protein